MKYKSHGCFAGEGFRAQVSLGNAAESSPSQRAQAPTSTVVAVRSLAVKRCIQVVSLDPVVPKLVW